MRQARGRSLLLGVAAGAALLAVQTSEAASTCFGEVTIWAMRSTVVQAA